MIMLILDSKFGKISKILFKNGSYIFEVYIGKL